MLNGPVLKTGLFNIQFSKGFGRHLKTGPLSQVLEWSDQSCDHFEYQTSKGLDFVRFRYSNFQHLDHFCTKSSTDHDMNTEHLIH